MAGIRQKLILVVGILFLLDAGLLVFAKVAPSEPPKVFDVVGKLEKPETAEKLKKQLAEAGFEVEQTKEKGTKDVPNGYKLLLRVSDSDSASSLAKALKLQGHKVQVVPAGGRVIQYGGLYPKKQQAEAAAAKVKEKEKIVFEVQESTKQVPVTYHCLVIKGLNQEQATEAEGILTEGGAKVDTSEAVAGGEEAEDGETPSADETPS